MEIDCTKYPFAYVPEGIGAKGEFAKYCFEFQANPAGVGFAHEMLPRVDIESIQES